MKLATHYLTYTYYENGVIGTGDPMNFSDACDEYADTRDDGYDCAVYRMEPQDNEMFDVTDEADARIRHRLNKRYQDFPEWLAA